jgi:hypothetical protein
MKEVIGIAYGGAAPTDVHLASTIHCIDEEIIGWLGGSDERNLFRGVAAIGPGCAAKKEAERVFHSVRSHP